VPEVKTVCGVDASADVLVPFAVVCQYQLWPEGAVPVALMTDPVTQLGGVAVGVAGLAGGGPNRKTLPLVGNNVEEIAIVAVEEFEREGPDQEFVLLSDKTLTAAVEADLKPT
jgi:hypothetical protein